MIEKWGDKKIRNLKLKIKRGYNPRIKRKEFLSKYKKEEDKKSHLYGGFGLYQDELL